jgi:hypothetical protein
MSLLPSNIPARNCVPRKIINHPNTIVGVDAQAPAGPGVDVSKGKKRALDSDADEGRVDTSKKLHLVPYAEESGSDGDIEMADDVQ